jgi:hypothetical protein
MGPIEGASLWTGLWIVYIIVIVMLIYHRHKPIDSINLLGSERRCNVFPVRYGQTYRIELGFK